MQAKDLQEYLQSQKAWVQTFLSDLIRIPSLSGQEQELSKQLYRELLSMGFDVVKFPVNQDIIYDPDYSSLLGLMDYSDKFNIRVQLDGTNNEEDYAIAFNTHMDIVPPSTNHMNPYQPICDSKGNLFGRGSVDAKGQIAVLVLLLKTIKEFAPLRHRVLGHIVVEEEVGGNGTLSILKEDKDFSTSFLVNLEPTGMRIKSSARGALWFEMTFFGEPSHSGSTSKPISAIDKAIAGVSILKDYHKRLSDASIGYGLFAAYDNPMPLTIGQFNAGNFPSITAEVAKVAGVLGFLPNVSKNEVIDDIKALFLQTENLWLGKDVALRFTYKHNGFETSPAEPFVQNLTKICEALDKNGNVDAMTASSDGIYYSEYGIPTVIFGPGEITDAHSNHEKVNLEDILLAVKILYMAIDTYMQ